MTLAVITFSPQGLKVMQQLAAKIEVKQYLHHLIEPPTGVVSFKRVYQLTAEIFHQCDGIIYIAPCGVAVRAIAPLIQHKLKDPAVVCVDVAARHAVSLLSGHEGGANDLAVKVSNIINSEPVISTTTEAVKNIIVGIGCRRGKGFDELHHAVTTALEQVQITIDQVRYLATADVKRDEPGIIELSTKLQIPLRIIDSQAIRMSTIPFKHSDFVAQQVKLPAVSEPAALLSGRRTSLILEKTAFNGITIAIARENCTSLG